MRHRNVQLVQASNLEVPDFKSDLDWDSNFDSDASCLASLPSKVLDPLERLAERMSAQPPSGRFKAFLGVLIPLITTLIIAKKSINLISFNIVLIAKLAD